jgi:hypothetical protein
MGLEDDVRRDLERASRWERRYGVFLAACGALALAAAWTFDVWREWVIWSR